jgi:hypothetical protein
MTENEHLDFFRALFWGTIFSLLLWAMLIPAICWIWRL